MKDEYVLYIESIGITGKLISRIDSIYNFYNDIIPEEIKDIFITDYIKEDGSREYESLWFFSDNYLMESKEFIIKYDFDLMPNDIIYWNLIKKDYNLIEATEESRVSLNCKFKDDRYAYFKAAKGNCDDLHHIFKQYIVPKMWV